MAATAVRRLICILAPDCSGGILLTEHDVAIEHARTRWALGAGLVAVVSARLAALPKSHWELDEWLFHLGVVKFEPLEHHPHPPGYPLLIGLGKAVNEVVGDPFVALVTLATVSSVLLYLVLADAFGRICGDAHVGVAGALLFSMSPAMMVHSTTPMSDLPALLFLAIAVAAGARIVGTDRERGRAELLAPLVFGAGLSASVGCRPQYAPALVAMLLAGCTLAPSWRGRIAAVAAFTVVSVAWLVPLVVAAEGWSSFLDYQASQIATVAKHDAMLSRGTRSWVDLALRFTADGWGPRAFSVPLVAAAVAGLVIVARERRRHAMLLLVMAFTYLAFTLITTDPADGVRYGLPIQMALSCFLAISLARCARWVTWPRTAVAAAVVVASAASWVYVEPVLAPRRRGPSPPAQAAAWARANLGRQTVILPDPSLRPHVDLLLPNFPNRMKPDEGFAKYWDRPGVEVYLVVEGQSPIEEGRTYSWPASDAYRRLTRNHYRVVSILPLEPGRRYLPIQGVHDWERHADLGGWRWLDTEARLRIPPGEGPVEVALEAPVYVPFTRTRVELLADDEPVVATTIDRGETAMLCVDFPAQGGILTVRSTESFVPADVDGHDRRRLALKLRDLRRLRQDAADARDPAGCAKARRAA